MKPGLRPVLESLGGSIAGRSGRLATSGALASGGAGRRFDHQRSDRAQTTLDFAIGASVFLIAVGFVVWFAPSMFDPFADSEGPLFVLAERTASFLAEDALAVSPSEPARLDYACTVAFFNGTAADCDGRIDPSEESIETIMPIEGGHPIDRNVNVSLHELNGTPDEPIEVDGDRLTRGSEGVPSEAVVSSRVVSVPELGAQNETRFKLTVRVW